MDVTFTNVLEGARQYFQGLPTTGTGPPTMSPAYSSEAGPSQGSAAGSGMPQPSSNVYWPTRAADAAPREHAQNHHRHASSSSSSSQRPESSRPPPTSSSSSRHAPHYVQSVTTEPNRNIYPGAYQENYQHQHLHHSPQQQYQQRRPLQQSQNQQQPQQEQQFQFSRPHTRETPSSYPQYQPHISTGSPYQQSQSPYQVPTPQQPRVPSRESIVPRVPSREQSTPRAPSREQTVPATSSREQQYPHTSDYLQARSYYPQSSQSKSATYTPTSQQTYTSQQQNKYYKHVYAQQQSHQSVYAGSRREEQPGSGRAGEPAARTSHNLPPIAAISNYHSSRASREPAKPTTSTGARTKAPYAPVTTSSIIQQNPAAVAPTYQEFRSFQRSHTTTAQSYTNVIVTATNTPSYYNASQSHVSSRSYQPAADATARVTVKRESPLDLSVKTVRTPADSTLSDADQDGRKLYQNSRLNRSLNYPQANVSAIQRTATAPKVEFRPNFNLPSLTQPRRPPEKAAPSNPTPPRYPTNLHAKTYPVPPANVDELRKKRPAETQMVTLPNKVAKVGDALWQSIDLQIEERFSNYKQQQQAKMSSKATSPVVNGAYQERPKEQPYSGYPKQGYGGVSQYQYPTSHSQTYVPTPASHQYPGYSSLPPHQPPNPYQQPPSRSFSSSLTAVTNVSKSNAGGAVDKRVLSLLRNSLEVKGQKKLEREQKSNENPTQYPRPDIQHPSTDVTAPLQPKPGFISRNNVSPFTPTSFPESSNLGTVYKLQMPKAVDSINFGNTKNDLMDDKQTMDTVITNHNNNVSSDYDGLAAAFIAARIRTKGELKQGGPPNTQTLSNNEEFIESPVKQDSSSNCDSPVKVQAERPRKRLFSRNEEDPNHFSLPPRDKSGLRSSSETSVFDFPDSDSEYDAGKESLEAMRKSKKTSKQSTPVMDIKVETPSRPASPVDDIFTKLCDNFVEQLKSGAVGKKTSKKKRGLEPTLLANLETATKNQPIEETVQIKVEVLDEEEVVENKTEVVENKTEVVEDVLPPKEEQVEEDQAEPEAKLDLRKQIENDLNSQDDEDKEEDPVFQTKKLSVRRKLVSVSEISDDLEVVTKDQEEQTDISEESNVVEKRPIAENNPTELPPKVNEILPIVQPTRKPSFGDGSDFYPGWEEGVFKYKKSLRMPAALIQVSRPPQFHRKSTSLPDLDPCPHSPTTSLPADDKESKENKTKLKKVKSEVVDSDNESNSSFNILYGKKTNYDSEGSLSIRSLPNTAKEMSIIDKLLEKCGGRKRKKYKRKDDHNPKVIPKTENPLELLATPSLEIKEEKGKETKKLSSSPIIKAQSPLLNFRKSTINNFKDAFVKRSNNIPGVNEFTTVVMNSRTRRETRVQKQRATIKEVFGEDRPASAPPVTCLNDMQMQIKEESVDENCSNNLVVKLEEGFGIKQEEDDGLKLGEGLRCRKKDDSLFKAIVERKIKTEIEEDSMMEDDTRSLDNVTIKSETVSLDGDNDGSVSGKRRGKFGKMRRKLSSGFDYIRKKKKVKKETADNEGGEKKKKKSLVTKTLESVDDIQKEIKTWVLNKGIGETHLHRAARAGLTDVTAYCLEKIESNPSPKDNAGYTPLHWACSKGHLDIAKLLLQYGANPSESAQGGIRPLHEAVENGFVEIARLLLSYGADPTLATYAGMTPLALTNDEVTKDFLKNHLNDIEGEPSSCWTSFGPASVLDPVDEIGYNHLDNVPESDPLSSSEEDIEFEMSEQLLPNLYTLRSEPPEERWVLLQDLSGLLKIKSRDALLKQLSAVPTTSSGGGVASKAVMRELKMSDFLEQARCCQFLNAGEKINTRASKIALVKYTDKVKELLKVESVVIEAR